MGDAGKIAGVEVLRILNEPTAASLAYGLDKKQNETILVFDLGGGTFDVSVLEVGDGIFEVLSTAGDTNLGGDDFDKALVRWLVEDFKAKEGTDLTKDIQALQRLTEAAEKAKMELSNVETTTINLPFITADKTGPKHIQQDLTREKFETLCSDLINRCRIPVEKALKDAKLDQSGINEVVLVGGIMTKLIARNTTIPVKKSELFSTAADNQTNVEIHVLQGEREIVSGNKSLGNFKLEGIPEAPKGRPQIEVTFDINVDGLLSVTAKENESGKQQTVTIQESSNLSESEIDTMIEEAEKYALSDNEQKEGQKIRSEALQSCVAIEEKLENAEIANFTENEKEEIKSLIQTLRAKVANKDESTTSIN